MSHFHILVVFVVALLVVLATGFAEVDRGRYTVSPSTRRAPSSSPRCKPISLAELKAMPFWQTFYDRLSVIVWGHPGEFDTWKHQGIYPFSLETTFDDGSDEARVCSEGTITFQTIGEPICYVTTTYSKGAVVPASGNIRFDYPTGLSTVVAGTVTKVGAPLTGRRTYETAFKVQDVTPTGADSVPGKMNTTHTVNALYPDIQGNSFEVDANSEHDTYLSIHRRPGEICSINYHNTTCIQEATGQAAFSLWGAVRVGFDSRVNGQYYWVLWFDSWVPGNQVWSYSQFNATITTTGTNDYIPGWECK
ncbi:hypothetical protein C8F04DRAFT_1406395 [Mycena alexandri]|uniref:Uncharacterized protein n=1 Tax=Mycena alexandri TaxID=1745969 RepID=A0AAD6RY46_9AGAR|nr:hypothetical protein C8F04DRAFT_1406395 [Mycena alexandri]